MCVVGGCAGHSHDVKAVSWHPRKSLIASGGKDSVVRLWDPSTGKEVKTLHCHKSYVRAVAWNCTGGMLLTSSNDRVRCLLPFRVSLAVLSCRVRCDESVVVLALSALPAHVLVLMFWHSAWCAVCR